MLTAAPDRVEAALRAVGPWAPDLTPDERYVSLSTLIDGGLAGRIAARLGAAPVRVGHSALLMGVTSRLWAVTVVPLAAAGVMLDPRALVARDDAGALRFGVSEPRGYTAVTPDELAYVLLDFLQPVVDVVPLAARLLWGNAAASLLAVPRVNRLPQAVPLVADLLARPPFADTLDLASSPPGRRRTCCLFYLVDGAGLCGDCVLSEIPD